MNLISKIFGNRDPDTETQPLMPLDALHGMTDQALVAYGKEIGGSFGEVSGPVAEQRWEIVEILEERGCRTIPNSLLPTPRSDAEFLGMWRSA